MTSQILSLTDLYAGYGQSVVLNGLNLDVYPGQRVALLGRNGVGKSTTLRTMMGLTNHVSGSIQFNGRSISHLKAHQRAQLGLGYVPQTRDIFPSLTVEENLIAGLKDAPRREIQKSYELFPRLLERRLNKGNQLSGGEQQMLSVARALLGNPTMLLMDEPLEGLAPIIRQELLVAFTRMADEHQLSILVVEQQVQEILGFAQHVYVMEHGAVVYQSSAAELLKDGSALELHVGLAAH